MDARISCASGRHSPLSQRAKLPYRRYLQARRGPLPGKGLCLALAEWVLGDL